ncbi:hypothetical protein PIB30_088028, partial [Stylosanthes scabra]|nr:hypothetical protein [Stylosanthes scabra]
IEKELHSFKQISGPDPNYNDICFSGAGSDVSQLSNSFPVVDLVFGNGQKYSLSPENYMFRHSKVRGAYCLGVFQNGKDPTTLLGGIVVRNTLVTYDREHKKVGFWKTNCGELWEKLQISNTSPSMPPNSGVTNSSQTFGPSIAPTAMQRNAPPGEIQITQITIVISFNISYVDLKPRIPELTGLIANGLDVNTSQVHLLNLTSFGSSSISRWAIIPSADANYISNTTAKLLRSIQQLTGSSPNWWQQYYWVVGLSVLVTLLIGLLAFKVFAIWRRQESVHTYKPVNAAVPEQELQPL